MKYLTLALLCVACGGSEEAEEKPEDSGTHVHDTGSHSTTTDTEPGTNPHTQPHGTVDCSDPAVGPVDDVIFAALSTDEWVYVDLDAGTVVTPADPDNDLTWELAFQQWTGKLNGGTSGSGDVAVAVFPELYDNFDNECGAPPHGYVTDTDEAAVLGTWYDYDPTTHAITPSDKLYFVKSNDGTYYRMRFTNYYDDNGEPHTITIQRGAVVGF